MALGLTLALQSRSAIRLPGINYLWLLAAFGLLHGIYEWMEMAALIACPVPGGGSPTALNAVKLLTLFVSFAFLLQFGISTLIARQGWWPWLNAVPLLLLALSAAYLLGYAPELDGVGSTTWLAIGQAIARYGIGLTGSLLAAWVLWRTGRKWQEAQALRVAGLLSGAAISFALYAIFAGFIVSPAPFFPASFVNSDSFFATLGIPVQLPRALCAVAITYFMIRAFFLEAARLASVAYEAEKQRVHQLQELDRTKDEFIAVAAHELKTPVAVMKGYAQTTLRMAGEIPEPVPRMLQAIDRGADRMDRIVKDLLDISQFHLGRLELAQEKIDLLDLVKGVVKQMAQTAAKHRIRIVTAEPVDVEGDRDRLEQVLINLMDNAIKYSPKGGDIDVAVGVSDHEAVVSVRDYGIGIPKEKQAHIFERLYRAHTGTPYDYGGMGVGLYISREIIARHGGRIWFESEEGKGSTFYFTLPLVRTTSTTEATESVAFDSWNPPRQ